MANVTIKSYRKEREKEILDGLEKSMEKVGAIVERQAKINVSKSPPEHPQRQSSDLINSIFNKVEKEGNSISVVIGSRITKPPYPRYLEFGTSRMPPYPWLFPAVEMSRDKIVETLKGREFRID